MSDIPQSTKDVFEELFLQKAQLDALSGRFDKMQLSMGSISHRCNVARQEQTSASSRLQKEIDDLKEQVQTNAYSVHKVMMQQGWNISAFEKELDGLKEHMRDVMNPQMEDSTHDDVLSQRVGALELAVSAIASWKTVADCQLDNVHNEMQKHAGPPETHILEYEKTQSAELVGEEPDTVSADAAKADSNLERVERERSEHRKLKNVCPDREYEWEASVYDAMILIALPGVNFVDASVMVFQFLVNLIMVGVTVVILGTDTFTSQPYSDIDSMLLWRHTDGHSAFYVDPFSQTTLVSRVCDGDDRLSIGTRQTDIFIDMSAYEDDGGLLLANVAVVLWLFCCAVEVRRALYFVFSILSLPRTKQTEFDQDDAGGIRFTGFSCSCRCLACFIFLVRLAAASALLAEGTVWLAYTTSITELLLNASALGFVLDIDDYIFEAIGLQRIISLHSALKPTPLPKFKSLIFIPFGITAGTVAFMVYVNIALLYGVVDEGMKELRAAICQPEDSQQIAFGTNPLNWMLYVDLRSSRSQGTHLQFVATEVIDGGSDADGYAYQIETLSALQQASSSRLADYTGSFPCEDLNTLPGESGSLGQRLWTATADTRYRHLRTCWDARPYCREEGALGNNVRFMCPVTCGCAFGRSPEEEEDSLLPHVDLLWDKATSKYGCPQIGCAGRKGFFLRGQPCEDANVSVLQHNGWNEVLQQLQSWGLALGGDFASLSERGCEALASLHPGTQKVVCGMLDSTLDFHGLSAVCPVACQCQLKSCVGYCPGQCCRTSSGPGSAGAGGVGAGNVGAGVGSAGAGSTDAGGLGVGGAGAGSAGVEGSGFD